MGNCACIDSSAKVDTAQSLHTSSEISKNSSKTSISSGGPSLTFPSYRKSAESLPTPRSEGEILSSPNVKAFSFNELKNATRNFRPDSLLGEGGFGYVFKGWIDEHTLTAVKPGSGMVIAVKRLKPEGFQGHKEWLDFNAKLSDFGLAKAGPTGDRTHVSTQVVGTHGYAAPEYVATGRLTTKSDVYSFGVVLLELLTGRSAVDKSKLGVEQNLVDWAKPYLGDKRKVFRIMDTKLAGQYPQKAAYTASTLALQCLCVEPRLRPRIIDVLEMLEQVQAPKTASKNSISDHQTVSDSNRKLPSRSQRSSTDRKPTAASLPPHRQSSG
ncbi:hypothetical protein RHMOL_Rhmol12G0065500 [Rhododendron molle]|uniref:Uncharacterized protein n=1 Tax=Rhododendron molle TaxID=49168 RepID=A0ACC0LEZ4_RHOML|nr:hypothetical protein RHMOL_Rhmol12G0065500 [Rhododendron molle]